MKKTPSPRAIAATVTLLVLSCNGHTRAVEALLLQDTYVDNGTSGGKPPPNGSNYGAGTDLRVFKGNGRVDRTFLKFSLATLPAGTVATDITQARLRFWVNGNSTIAGSITLSPVTAGTQGPQGAPGPARLPGPTGPPGEIGLQGTAGPPGPAAVWPTPILPRGDLAMGEFTRGSPP